MSQGDTRFFASPARLCSTRRNFLRLGAAGLLFSAPCSSRSANAAPDATDWLQGELRNAARAGGTVRLPAGVISIRSVEVPDGVAIVGARGSVLRLMGPAPLLSGAAARRITLESVTFDGGGNRLADQRGLLDFTDVLHLSIHGCVIRRFGARGVNLLRCGGRFAQNIIEDVRDAGYFSLDGLGVDIDGNTVRECGDNGVQVWTSVAGRLDGSRIRNNAISDIHNLSGGDGAYGNGVSIFRSGGVRVENNVIRRCAYTAVRNNAGHDIVVIGNDCKTCGERAMYAEFGAKRAAFRDNKIDDAGAGIAVTNADQGTDVGWVTGNVITGLRETHPDDEFGPEMSWLTGVEGESNIEIAGNTIVGSPWIGIRCGGYRQNVRVESNTLVDNEYGVAFQIGGGVGAAIIAHNKIYGSKKAAIVALAGNTFMPGDVSAPGAASKHPLVTIRDNDVR
ncbi:MAG: TIGR03808 family TAT-translocated repetitive protein [Methylocystis sp.]|nr:TIGR03808 family TAT-translocated repetitive protein [Methylocystis sp.]